MLQNSHTYVLARPAVDPFAQWSQNNLPNWLTHRITRPRFQVLSLLFVKCCTLYPLTARKFIEKATLKQLSYNVPNDPRFSPRNNPWEQRFCLCSGGDFFKAMRADKASVITETITTMTETGIQLASFESVQTLETDVIVTATGFKLKIAGGARISLNIVPVTISEKFLWNGIMLQDLPDTATVIGYTNASWTLGADATTLLVCRLLKRMTAKRLTSTVPRVDDTKTMKSVPAPNFSSTYIVRGAKDLPKTGDMAL